jgi:hypothetical protein
VQEPIFATVGKINMTKLFHCVSLLLGTALLVGCDTGEPVTLTTGPTDQPNPPVKEKAETDAPADDAPALEVNLSEVLNDFKSDEAAAKTKWVGKRVKFSGWSGTFNTDAVPFGQPIFLAVNSEKVSSLTEVISTPRIYVELQGNPWDTCDVFQPVIVEGTVEYDFGPKIKKGSVASPEGKPAPRMTVQDLASEAEADFAAAKEKYAGHWLTLTGKVLEQTAVNPESDLSNGLVILFRSDNLVIQGEYSSGPDAPLGKVKAGEQITIGDEVDFLGPLTDQPSLIHFSMPYFDPKN